MTDIEFRAGYTAGQADYRETVAHVADVLAEMVASTGLLDRQRVDDCVHALRGELGAPGSEFDA